MSRFTCRLHPPTAIRTSNGPYQTCRQNVQGNTSRYPPHGRHDHRLKGSERCRRGVDAPTDQTRAMSPSWGEPRAARADGRARKRQRQARSRPPCPARMSHRRNGAATLILRPHRAGCRGMTGAPAHGHGLRLAPASWRSGPHAAPPTARELNTAPSNCCSRGRTTARRPTVFRTAREKTDGRPVTARAQPLRRESRQHACQFGLQQSARHAREVPCPIGRSPRTRAVPLARLVQSEELVVRPAARSGEGVSPLPHGLTAFSTARSRRNPRPRYRPRRRRRRSGRIRAGCP